MFIALSFVGILPSYIIECCQQIRYYFEDEVFLITNDINSLYINELKQYNINIIEYNDVKSDEFNNIVKLYYNKFPIINKLAGREKLFIHCFERFFLLYNLMKLKNLEDSFYMEIDNLIYDNPNKWISQFAQNELCYMYDNDNRFSSGIMYVKKYNSLDKFLKLIIKYIETHNGFLHEMETLAMLYQSYPQEIQILPTYWNDNTLPYVMYSNYNKYSSLFDSAPYGTYLLGADPFHTNGIIIKGMRSQFAKLDCTKNIIEWKIDSDGLRKPYIFKDDENKWILINNLHVHSKDLKSGLSK
jgi:hypothetical protein